MFRDDSCNRFRSLPTKQTNRQTDRHTLPKTLPRRPSPTGRGNSVDGARSKRPLLQAQATLRSGLQIYLRPRVTLTFDLLTPKLIVSCPCPVNHLCQLASKSIRSFTVFRSFVTDGRTDRRTNGHYEPTRTLRSSSFSQLSVPQHNLEFGSRAFRISAPKIWNLLPASSVILHQSLHFAGI